MDFDSNVWNDGDDEDFGAFDEQTFDADFDLDDQPLSIDSVLSMASPLFSKNQHTKEDYENRVELIKGCMAKIFGNHDTEVSTPSSYEPLSLMTPRQIHDAIGPVAKIDNEVSKTDRQLLRKIVLASALCDPKQPTDKLLGLPNSQTTNEGTTTAAATTTEDTCPLPLDKVRQIVSIKDSTDQQLKHALYSIDTMISAKQEEVAKRKDAIDAYNQVIQTLVDQASKISG